VKLIPGRAAVLTAAAALAAVTIPGGLAQAAVSAPGTHRPTAPPQALTWSIVSSPNPGSTNGPAQFNGISCPSAGDCVAVGQYTLKTGVPNTLIESWNGAAWSVVRHPSRGTAPAGSVLYGVSCVSQVYCAAVGDYGKKTLIESWNGSRWSVVPSPDNKGRNVLAGVSCASATSCMAVGLSNDKILAESWNGTTWSIVHTPNPAPAGQADSLKGVSCVSASSCTAVGGGPTGTLVESWNGSTWSVVPTPSLGSSTVSDLSGISCVSASSCMAVGMQEVPDFGLQTLAESWDGTAWSAEPTPDPSLNYDNYLAGVSCLTAGDCTAVGWYDNSNGVGGATSTLTESWDGTSWSTVSSPNKASAVLSNQLNGASCASDSTCVAAGWYDNSHGRPRTLAELGTSG
jgi:hypothetical protein